MTSNLQWISKSVVVDWYLTDPVTGAPLDATTVTGTITKPDASTAAMVVTHIAPVGSGHYQAAYDPTVAGTHAYRLVATGAADSAEEGTFYVKPSRLGALPITLDPTLPIGQTRLLVSDVDEDNAILTDAQYTGLLTLEGGNITLAAARALDIIATSEALISKVIKSQDLQTDGPALAVSLRAQAATLRANPLSGTTGGGLLPIWAFPDPVSWGDQLI